MTRIPAVPWRYRVLHACLACVSVIVLIGISSTGATLTDQATMAQVSVAAASVNPPHDQTPSPTAGAVRVSWSAPTAGLVPDGYEVFRSTSPGSYGPTPLATPPASPFVDSTAVECTDYYYRTRARRMALMSSFTPEAGPVSVDDTPPTLSTARAHAYFDPAPLPKVADFVRVAPGGSVEVYAQVSDNCSPTGSGIDVDFTLGAPITATVAATFGSYTPVAGGPTYNYRYGPFALAANSIAHGSALTWTIHATDTHGNATSVAGTAAVGDGVAPQPVASNPAAVVSGQTNYFSSALGHGEVVSGLGSAALKTAGFWTYANLTDTAGVSSATANIASLRTGSSAVPLVAGAFSTDNGVGWGWRTAAITVPNVNAASGSMQPFSIHATDVLGNAATVSSELVEIDNAALVAASATCSNAGNANNALDAADSTSFDLGDTVDPASLRASWTTPPFEMSATAVLRDATRDFFDLNGDFGLTMFSGSTYDSAWNLNAPNWVTSNVSLPGSTVSLVDRQTVRLTYGTPASAVTAPNRSAGATLGTSVRDAAGNPIAASFTESCATGPW